MTQALLSMVHSPETTSHIGSCAVVVTVVLVVVVVLVVLVVVEVLVVLLALLGNTGQIFQPFFVMLRSDSHVIAPVGIIPSDG